MNGLIDLRLCESVREGTHTGLHAGQWEIEINCVTKVGKEAHPHKYRLGCDNCVIYHEWLERLHAAVNKHHASVIAAETKQKEEAAKKRAHAAAARSSGSSGGCCGGRASGHNVVLERDPRAHRNAKGIL